MSAPAGCQLTGRWRIVEADLWDRGYLDLSGPAMITIGEDNNGEIAFGALQAGLDLSYSPSMVFSTTARSRSLSPITTATRLPSKPTGILLQQPASFLPASRRASIPAPTHRTVAIRYATGGWSSSS